MAVILADGLINNGGVVHTFECLGPEMTATIEAFEWFGIEDGAALLRSVAEQYPLAPSPDGHERQGLFEHVPEARSEWLDEMYYTMLPNSDRLESALTRRIAEYPAAFSL